MQMVYIRDVSSSLFPPFIFFPFVIYLFLCEEDSQTRGNFDHFLAYYGLIIL